MFYDIANFDVDMQLARLLGFGKIFAIGRDLSLNAEGENIIVDDSYLHKFQLSKVVGVRPSNVDLKLFQKIKEDELFLIIDISSLFSRDFQKEYKRLRNILRNAIHLRLMVKLASFAQSKEGLLSALQLIEVAKFLGASEEQAKDMLRAKVL